MASVEDDDVLRVQEVWGHSPYGPVHHGSVSSDSAVTVVSLQPFLEKIDITPLSAEGRRFSEHLCEAFESTGDLGLDSNYVLFPLGVQWPDDGSVDDAAAVVTERARDGEILYDQQQIHLCCGCGQNKCEAKHWSWKRTQSRYPLLDVCDLVDVACDLAKAVRNLHENSVVHGNICSGLLSLRREGKHTKARLFYCCVSEAVRTTLQTYYPEYLLGQATSAPERVNGPLNVFQRSEDVYCFGATMLELCLGRPLSSVASAVDGLSGQHPLHDIIVSCTGSQPQLRPNIAVVMESCESLRLRSSYVGAWSPEAGEYVRKLEEGNELLGTTVEGYQSQLKRCNGMIEHLLRQEEEMQKRLLSLQDEFTTVNAEHQQVVSLVENLKAEKEKPTAAPMEAAPAKMDQSAVQAEDTPKRAQNGHPAVPPLQTETIVPAAAAAAAAAAANDHQAMEVVATLPIANGYHGYSTVNGRPSEHDSAVECSGSDRGSTPNGHDEYRPPSGSPDVFEPVPETSAARLADLPKASSSASILSSGMGDDTLGSPQWMRNNEELLEGNTKYSSLKRRKRSTSSDSQGSPARDRDIAPSVSVTVVQSSPPVQKKSEEVVTTEVNHVIPLTGPGGRQIVRRSTLADGVGISAAEELNARGSQLRRSASQHSSSQNSAFQSLDRRNRGTSLSPSRGVDGVSRRSRSSGNSPPPSGNVQRMALMFKNRAQVTSPTSPSKDWISSDQIRVRPDHSHNGRTSMSRPRSFSMFVSTSDISNQPDAAITGRASATRTGSFSLSSSAGSNQFSDVAAGTTGTSRPSKKRITSVSERVGAAREKGIADDTWWMMR